MGLEYLRRWQWAALGILAGMLVAGVKVYQGPVFAPGVMTVHSTFDIERFTTLPPWTTTKDGTFKTRGKVDRIVVHPINDEGRVWVTFDQYELRTPPGTVAIPKQLSVGEFFKPNLTFRACLADLKQRHPEAQVDYRYAWEEVPRNLYLAYGAAGMVLIGGIWPSVIGLITGAGIWGPPRRKEKEYDLSRFASGEEPKPATEVTPADRQHLEELESELAAKLQSTSGDAAVAGVPEEQSAVRPLTAEPVQPTTEPEHEPKDYKGEYYPVSRPGEKKAFSLVELIVVIGVIALLVSILIPVLSVARQSAVDLVCMNQLRQVGIAFNAYLVTFKTVPPPVNLFDSNVKDVGTTWPKLLIDLKYMPDMKVLRCPLGYFPGTLNPEPPANLNLEYSFAYGYRCDSGIYDLPLRFPQGVYLPNFADPVTTKSIGSPSDFYIVADSYNLYFGTMYVIDTNTIHGIGLRHRRRTANALMADGSARPERRDYFLKQNPDIQVPFVP